MDNESIPNPIEVGDWIKIIKPSFSINGYVGFVLEHDFWNSRFRVKLTLDDNGQKLEENWQLWVPDSQLITANDDRHEKDLSVLIDFALDNNDQEWFKELTSMLPQGNW